MAGMLARYYSDFLWLLFTAAAAVFLCLNEKIRGSRYEKALRMLLLVLAVQGLLSSFFEGIGRANLQDSGRLYGIFLRLFT